MPQNTKLKEVSLDKFSSKRAFEHLEKIAQKPHYVGSKNHEEVRNILISELEKLGLETQIQEGFSLTKWGNGTKSYNILARKKGSGTGKAVLLLSHYDSAPHSKSLGANDDGVGVVTILESFRAFLHNHDQHQNDIIILFSDAEELGLNGAALFVQQHPWAKDVGVVLNLEARGSAGPSYMLMEATNGNEALLRNFANANVRYPASNSLMYSIYKLLPNDTDLTIFRETGKIPGFNFAYIDNHFNYHTSQDNLSEVALNTLEHQGTYITALLDHFASSNLENLETTQDYIYFNTPLGFFFYPFSYNTIFYVGTWLLLLVTLFIGFSKKALHLNEILKGFVPLLVNIVSCGLLGFFGWKLLTLLYPEYKEMLHGFTYNGHSYIYAFSLFAIALCFWMYRNIQHAKNVANYFVAPIVIWLLLLAFIIGYLPGGGFFILPTIFAVLYLLVFVLTQRHYTILALIFSIPAVFIIVPFVSMFPIGLGLKMLAGSLIIIALVFSLLLPVFSVYTKKSRWAFILLLVSIGFFTEAHLKSDFVEGKGKPNSLVYVLDADTEKAYWSSYDDILDEWTSSYLAYAEKGKNPLEDFKLFSKYQTQLNYKAEAPVKDIPEASIVVLKDSTMGKWRHLIIEIKPNRLVNRYDILANEKVDFYHLKMNGVKHVAQVGAKFSRNGEKLLSYYVVDQTPLRLDFMVKNDADLQLKMLESSFDLLENDQFSIPARPKNCIAKPFVLTDAIIVRKKITLTQNKSSLMEDEN